LEFPQRGWWFCQTFAGIKSVIQSLFNVFDSSSLPLVPGKTGIEKVIEMKLAAKE
jgi:hypothetical protein